MVLLLVATTAVLNADLPWLLHEGIKPSLVDAKGIFGESPIVLRTKSIYLDQNGNAYGNRPGMTLNSSSPVPGEPGRLRWESGEEFVPSQDYFLSRRVKR